MRNFCVERGVRRPHPGLLFLGFAAQRACAHQRSVCLLVRVPNALSDLCSCLFTYVTVSRCQLRGGATARSNSAPHPHIASPMVSRGEWVQVQAVARRLGAVVVV
jgi:hypothetical protein